MIHYYLEQKIAGTTRMKASIDIKSDWIRPYLI